MARDNLDAYREKIARLVNEHGATLAYSSAAPSTFCGFACAAPDRLEYVYVPSEMRAMGLGRALITHAMSGYPGRIECGHAWPWKSSRFVYEPEPVRAAS